MVDTPDQSSFGRDCALEELADGLDGRRLNSDVKGSAWAEPANVDDTRVQNFAWMD